MMTLRGVAGLLLAALLILPATAQEEEESRGNIHWAYANYFGTGWYSIGNDRDVFVLKASKRWSGDEAGFDDDGTRRYRTEWRLPVLFGLNRFELDDPLGVVDLDNVAFVSVNPSFFVEVPVTRRWTLKPQLGAGYGEALDGSESAWTYAAVVRSRVSFEAASFDWHILNLAGFVGYTPDRGPSDRLWPLMAALAVDYPIGEPGGGRELHWHLAYTTYASDLDFVVGGEAERPISDEWELGVAITRPGQPLLRLGWLEFERLGLGYRRSSNGELEGITFLFHSLFDK
jgi:hypothetical protein